MRELKMNEIDAVSGAGLLADVSFGVGNLIGSLADGVISIVGLTTSFEVAGSTIGLGIGQLLELDLQTGFSSIRNGLTGICSSIRGIF